MANRKSSYSKRKKRVRIARILAVWAVVVVAGLIVVFFVSSNRDKTPDPEQPANDRLVFASPIPGPESAQLPVIEQRDGLTYITVDGVEILLVNKQYSVPENYGGEDAEAAAALARMMEAAEQDGVYFYLVSGYRSYNTQAAIHENYVSQYGQEYTDTISAKPGHSEHQTGLAFDLLDSTVETGLNSGFADTPAGQWLYANAPEYGFILRYGEGMTWATGYAYEPWHFRYIGDAALARRITNSGLPLEQYAGLIEPEA